MRRLRNKIPGFIEFLGLDKFPDQIIKRLTPGQKKILKKLISEKRREQIRNLFISDISKINKEVENLKYKLFNLGFTERAYRDLEQMAFFDVNEKRRQLATEILLLWHCNQYHQEDARKGLELISILKKNICDINEQSKLAIMEAECLSIIGRNDQAREILLDQINTYPTDDLYLALSNATESIDERMEWINLALAFNQISPISLDTDQNKLWYDRLKSVKSVHPEIRINSPKVTVIMPVYNSESVIQTALESITNQTWDNLEIIVVDDGSTDCTTDIVKHYASSDPRIQLMHTPVNSGPYVARNIALQAATGEFVTCHDADDWSHCEKIERQVLHLLNNPKLIGNMSVQARMSDRIIFNRRGKFGSYIFSNMSSFMFRRQPVMERIGFWDCVRFGADSEFIRRIRMVFGEKAVSDVPGSLLSFQRQSGESLTGNKFFGYYGFFMGSRKEYFESFQYYHSKITERRSNDYKYEFPQNKRKFAIPRSMAPDRTLGRKHYDVIIASDFRLLGGSTISSLEEIKAQYKMGLSTGLIQIYRYDYPAKTNINPKIRDIVNMGYAEMITYGEKVSCDVLIIRYPPVLQEKQRFLPDVKASNVCVIVNQTPKSDYGDKGQVRYQIQRCFRHLSEWIDAPQVWYPIGPLVRDTLYKYHQDELKGITISDEDWVNIIDVDSWWMDRAPIEGRKPVIGRHSRDEWVKWPASKEEILRIYPDRDDIKVLVLGGKKTLGQLLGRIPKNWKVYEFGEMDPKQFLSGIDLFVYYTHSDWIESFGRVIIEALASGIPVILPPIYKPLFREAAIYAEIDEVREVIIRVLKDREFYRNQLAIQKEYVERNFGYTMHQNRLNSLVGRE